MTGQFKADDRSAAQAPGGSDLPETARQINTDFGTPGWGGPCPPQGCTPPRFTFTV